MRSRGGGVEQEQTKTGCCQSVQTPDQESPEICFPFSRLCPHRQARIQGGQERKVVILSPTALLLGKEEWRMGRLPCSCCG